MLKFGTYTQEQYARAGERRKFSGAHVAYSLLKVGDSPSIEEIRVFEDISFTLRTSNGTFRTSFRNRFRDVNEFVLEWLKLHFAPETPIHVEDRAVSHGLTSAEWAQTILPVYPQATFQASDLLLYLLQVSLSSGEVYICEPNGTPLQYINPPFVVSLHHREPRRYPVNGAVAAWARRKFARLNLPEGWTESLKSSADFQVTRISLVHPEAAALARQTDRFKVVSQSVFDCHPQSCDVLRTMNILNLAYFSSDQLAEAIRSNFLTVRPGGMWVVGRTLEGVLTNHVSFFERGESGWKLIQRIGDGSEIEDLALRMTAPLHS